MAGRERKKAGKGVRRCYGRDGERTAALLWERRGANGGAAMGETGSEWRRCYGSW